jgi:tRNA dimethylallyltransferase
MKKVLVIAGPTASGKSALAVHLAKRYGGEVISGDSIQVFRGMDIGSGKVTEEEKEGIPHHLIDILDPKDSFSAADFQRMAREWIEKIDVPIIAGGTGLYLKACLYDYCFTEEEDIPLDERYERMDNHALYEELRRIDPESAEKIHENNRRRVLRAIAIKERTGMTKSEQERNQLHQPMYDIFIAGCTMERSQLYERINRRVESMFEAGLEQEVRGLLEKGVCFDDPSMRGIGYQEFRPYFEGKASLEEVKLAIQKHSRNYAKRQYTWFNHQMPVHWYDVSTDGWMKQAETDTDLWRSL